MARQQMEGQGRSDEQINTALEVMKKGFWVFGILGVLFSYAIFGAIGSLIGAAITKKNPQTPFEEQH